MKKMIRYSFIAVAAMVILSSCSKDKDEVAKTKTELLTQGNWKIASDMRKIDSGPWIEDISNYAACELDDYMLFKVDHTAEQNEGATKCEDSDLQIESGVWAFTDNETKINLNGVSVTLDELTATTLIVSYSYTDSGITEYIKETYRH